MKMLHITIRTPKFEEEIRFYQEIVKLHFINDLRPMGSEIVFLADEEGDTCIEVIHRADPGAAADLGAAAGPADADNDNLSIGFKAADVDQMRADLDDKGYAPTPMISPNPYVRFFFVTDPAGVKVQFM